MTDWSLQRVEQLAPDSASLKAAQGLARPGTWQTLGRNEHVVWGECKGSGANPYQVRVDLSDSAYKCSCPSRKLPCKHSLGLLLLYVGGSTPLAAPPGFVQEWLAGRAKRADIKAAKASSPPEPVDEQAQQKRAAKRESRVESGLQLLEAALADLVAQGLAAARAQPASYWTQLSSRLVDTQSPGLARRVKALGDLLVGRTDWQSAALAEMSRLQLLIDAFRNIAQVPPDLAAEIRTLIGFTQEQKEVLAREGIRDRWLVAGREQSEEGTLRIQRTWLLGTESQRAALLLDFAIGNQPLPAMLMLGQCLDAELVFFDGAPLLRALIKERFAAPAMATQLPPGLNVEAMQRTYAQQLTQNPWLERWPTVIGPVTPLSLSDKKIGLLDTTGRLLPLDRATRHATHLLALSGGAALTVFGTWDGNALLPLSVADHAHLYGVGRLESLSILSRVA